MVNILNFWPSIFRIKVVCLRFFDSFFKILSLLKYHTIRNIGKQKGLEINLNCLKEGSKNGPGKALIITMCLSL